MFIALEGVDGAGKTALAKIFARRIREITGEPVVQVACGPPKIDYDSPVSPGVQVITELLSLLAPIRLSQTHVVSDRFHWGGPVYGPIFRPETATHDYGDLTRSEFMLAEALVRGMGGVIVLVTGDPHDLADRVLARGDDHLDKLLANAPKFPEQRNSLAWSFAQIQLAYDNIAKVSRTFGGLVQHVYSPDFNDDQGYSEHRLEKTLDFQISDIIELATRTARRM